LKHLIRPYQNCLYSSRVARICFVQGSSAKWSKATDIERHYFGRPGRIYVDKVSKFACEVIRRTRGLPLQRLEEIFDEIYIDEIQDLAAYDLELLELLLNSGIRVTLVGDHRQATFSTNKASKNKKYARSRIIDKFEEWKRVGLCELQYQYHSHRCAQAICDYADKLHPGLPKTISFNKNITGHDGVFCIRRSQVSKYIASFHPQVLRYNRKQKELPGNPINFGNAKGMTFARTLIFPHKALEQYLMTDNIQDAGKENHRDGGDRLAISSLRPDSCSAKFVWDVSRPIDRQEHTLAFFCRLSVNRTAELGS
jgi:DNA helicase-2/ATP-dependent DNA helicase PcrA